MFYVPDEKNTLPLHLRQAIADQQHSPRKDTSDFDFVDPGIRPWEWMVEEWNLYDWEDWKKGDPL